MRPEETQLKDLINRGEAEDFFTRRTMDRFDPNAAGFSLPNAVWLMELPGLVYRREAPEPNPHPSPRSKFLGPQKLEEIAFFNKQDATADTQAMLVQSTNAPKWAALVFRGTEQKVTYLISDLELSIPLLGHGPIVHRGFKHALDIVWDDIKTALDQPALQGIPLF